MLLFHVTDKLMSVRVTVLLRVDASCFYFYLFICTFMCVYLLGDNRGHGDLQKLLLEGNKGQKAGVEEA